jgi:chemotaxis-related protein WspB
MTSMLALLFRLGSERFALDLAGLTAILPNSHIQPIPHAPPEVCGEFNWRGRMVPVIDLRQLFFGVPCEWTLTTRLVVFRWQGKSQRGNVALRAEGITDTVEYRPADLQRPTVSDPQRPGIVGSVVADGRLIRVVDPQALVWESFRDVMFRETAQ